MYRFVVGDIQRMLFLVYYFYVLTFELLITTQAPRNQIRLYQASMFQVMGS